MGIFNFSKHFEELNDNIRSFIASNIEYYRLLLFKHSTKLISKLVQFVIVISLFFFFLSLVSIGFSLWIGSAIGNLYSGFFIVGGFYFLVFIIFLIFRKELVDAYVLKQASKASLSDSNIDEIVDEPVQEDFENKNAKTDEDL